jgi:uncharacterized protein YkwD
MTRVRNAAVLALLVCVLAVPASAAAESAPMAMLKKVNAYRAKHGIGKLRLSRSLAHSAKRYSRHMMRSGYFGHSSRIHASGKYRTLGEIIEWHRSARPDPGWAFRNWLSSPGHRRVIMMGQFKYAGAGFATGRWQGHTTTMWTMHFGRK